MECAVRADFKTEMEQIMKNKKDREKIDFNSYNLKPSGHYLNSISDFADLLGSMDEAEKKAEELLKESEKKTGIGDMDTQRDDTAKAEADAEEKPDVDELLAQLDSLIGLEKIKENVKSLINLVKVRKLREENGLPTTPMSLHLVFMGNPGTGKTTVARLIAKLYYGIGVLSKGQLVETDRAGLVAGYVGQTAAKTKKMIDSAIGGVLFIDEAYALAPGGDGTNDFGREAIETLLKAMEDNRENLVVIVAGYEELMERFISSNPGLESRFNRYFIFDDYNDKELYDIFTSMCGKNKYVLTEDGEKFIKDHLKYIYDTRDENFGNARDVRNLFENIISAQSDRVAMLKNPTLEDLTGITKEDIERAAAM